MSDSSINPFASPTADISPSKPPEPDEVYPLVPTTKAIVTDVPAPFYGAVRPRWQRFLRGASESMIKVAFAVPFCLMYLFISSLYSPQFFLAVVLAIPYLWLVITLEKATTAKRWWGPRMLDQLQIRDDTLFSVEDTPYELVCLTTGQPKNQRTFRLYTKVAKIVDVGLIRFDKTNGEILLEGDRKRYRMPRGSLWNFELQEIRFNSSERAVVRLVMETENGPHEIHLLSTDTHTWRDFIHLDMPLRSRALHLAREIYEVNNPSHTPKE